MTNKEVIQKYVKAPYNIPHSGVSDVSGSNPAHSLFFVDNRIYSYGTHFLIAEKTGESTVTVTTRKYSVTTSKQTNGLAGALAIAGYTITRAVL